MTWRELARALLTERFTAQPEVKPDPDPPKLTARRRAELLAAVNDHRKRRGT